MLSLLCFSGRFVKQISTPARRFRRDGAELCPVCWRQRSSRRFPAEEGGSGAPTMLYPLVALPAVWKWECPGVPTRAAHWAGGEPEPCPGELQSSFSTQFALLTLFPLCRPQPGIYVIVKTTGCMLLFSKCKNR